MGSAWDLAAVPADLEEKEAYFMTQVAKGESLCSEGMFLLP